MKWQTLVFVFVVSTFLTACSGGGGSSSGGDSSSSSSGSSSGGSTSSSGSSSSSSSSSGSSSSSSSSSSSGSSTGSSSSSGGSSSGGSMAPSLTAADEDAVAPCPDQAILTDSTALAALQAALANGALSFLDVPFNGGDPDNFKKKCGLEGFWDPANNINDITPASVGMTAITLAQLLTNGNAGICATGSLPTNNVVGFPAAGTYRTEIKVASGPSTWHLRLRSMVSGNAAGNEFSQESIVVPSDIENTLEYKVNGVVTAHDNLMAAMVAAASTSGDAINIDISKSSGGPTIFNTAMELICVSKS